MLETTLALFLFLLPLAYSPGPGNLFFAALGARFGLHGVLPALTGYHIATFIVTVAIGFGFAQLAETSALSFAVLRYGGAAYVLWLAWGLMRAGVSPSGDAAQHANARDGAILLLLNPKAYVIIALMFSQFLPKSESGSAALVLWISAVFTANNLLAFTLWAVAGDVLTRRFRDPSNVTRINLAFGLMLAAVAIWMMIRA